MDFTEIAAISGAFISLIAAYASLNATKARLRVERELQEELHAKLMQNSLLLECLANAKTGEGIKREVHAHLDSYFAMISSAMDELPPEKRMEVYPALSQKSEKGRASYMTKLLESSLKTIVPFH